MYSNDGGSPIEATWYDDAGAVWTKQTAATCSRKHVCLPKAAGDSKMPEQSPKGTTIEPKWSLNGRRAAWLPKPHHQVEPPRGRWGPLSPWWRWCRRGCKSFWRRALRAGRRADSRWRCSSRSRVSGRRRKWRRVERRRWCAPCCSGPAASESPEKLEKNLINIKFTCFKLCLSAVKKICRTKK